MLPRPRKAIKASSKLLLEDALVPSPPNTKPLII
jgi:hypothetical protein